jgi:pyrroloquinoline quinone biosynthesis protein B
MPSNGCGNKKTLTHKKFFGATLRPEPVPVLVILLFGLVSSAAIADSVTDSPAPYVFVLGVAQDAGYPQANCYLPHCMRAWEDPTLKRLTSCIAVVDATHGKKYLFDATPDMREQLYRLHVEAPDEHHDLAGVFLTHGHIGHYTGLMHFGREAVGASSIRVFAMPRMRNFLNTSGPWSQLVRLKNIELVPIRAGRKIALSDDLAVVPMQVPHRDEYSETVGYKIIGPSRSALFIPDIDKWSKWDTDVRDLVREVDYALLDGSFFADGELPGRDMSEIPHPYVQESIELFSELADSDKSKIIFIHFNHTNPLLIDGSDAQKEVTALGYRFATEGMRLPL